MSNDPTVQVAFIGIITTLITTAGVVLVAMFNNKKERHDTADEGVEATLRERLTLRDEQILDLLEEEKEALRVRLGHALEENEEKTMLIRHLRDELANQRDIPS